ncbi:hypothetical protein [Planctomicrobium piriforme]|uniref:Uncharacterized protein n=1 Tax=Planctomicrobium piriforme TaxID=1576369 RepID=A0A1I3T0D0_9PLAN|nr:hypothetical protein [Planctomicrobium piriforme]SFJ63027.1 hypothetical protein SAMN05421753_12613 [Planctomicrobium piriforme]
MMSGRLVGAIALGMLLAGISLGIVVGRSGYQDDDDRDATILHSGPVLFVYWQGLGDSREGYTSLPQGMSGANSSTVNAHARATVYENYVAVQPDEDASPIFVPRERLLYLQFTEEAAAPRSTDH